MNARIFSPTLFLALSLGLFSGSAVCEKLYKWVDESGNTFFADQISPEENKYQLEKLSKKARVIEIIEKPKTSEQLQQEKRLAELRKEQDKLIADQKIHDKSLLSTYQSSDDMRKALKLKMQTLDLQRKSIEVDLKFQAEDLDKKQALAAGFERNAQKIPDQLLADIKASQEKVKIIKQTLFESDINKKRVNNSFEADIKRFEALTKADQVDPAAKAKPPSIEESNALGVFRCENDRECNQAWDIARSFVARNSNTAPDINTDKLVMGANPSNDNDFSMSLSRIAIDDNNFELFLDFHCRDSSIGKELCASQKIQDLRESFRPYVNERLSSKLPKP